VDIPNNNTFRILEYRKNYLVAKSQKDSHANGYVQAEIQALDRIINFTKLIMDNLPPEAIEKVITEHETKNRPAANQQPAQKETYAIISSYEKQITQDHILRITFLENRGKNYIALEPRQRNRRKYQWENRGKYITTAAILGEILEQAARLAPDCRIGG
jgi:hypothetical protein